MTTTPPSEIHVLSVHVRPDGHIGVVVFVGLANDPDNKVREALARSVAETVARATEGTPLSPVDEQTDILRLYLVDGHIAEVQPLVELQNDSNGEKGEALARAVAETFIRMRAVPGGDDEAVAEFRYRNRPMKGMH